MKIENSTFFVRIGIDASRAFIQQRTGIEEYSYQVIRHLVEPRQCLGSTEVILYTRKNQNIDFKLPKQWKIKKIKFPYLWTQLGLSLEMLFHPVDVLFIPAHVVPMIHSKNTLVTIHGLEFEAYPEGYSFLSRIYMRWSIKMSCKWSRKIIAVSNNTKKDLIKLYNVPESKIEVVYEGIGEKSQIQNPNIQINSKFQIQNYKPYLLFIGRLEKRKNIEGIIESYRILKEKYNIPHALVLAGSPGYGYEDLKLKIKNSIKISNLKLKIIESGYVDEDLKWQLMSNTDVFLFPTFYEGFGLPVLEAQSAGVPVVASNNSSIPEIAGTGRDLSVQLVDPANPSEIAEAVHELISNGDLKDDIIKKGYENMKRFSWRDCSFRISQLLKDQK